MNKYFSFSKLKKYPKLCLCGVIALLLLVVIGFSIGTILENDVEVSPNSDLTYYLNVSYDGVDRLGVESSDKVVADVKSGYIHVEDKIPNGLKFNGFVTTGDGSIGAVNRDDGRVCVGYVVDNSNGKETLNDYHGLHYDEATRTVSFDVKNLMAGCILTVGIKTITPKTVDDPDTPEKETRRDFYNFATFKEDMQSGKTNTVHVWMGDNSIDTYKVSYEYTGTVPKNAPEVPETMEFVENTKVGVANNINVGGYEFSGWSSDDVEIIDGNFTMPAKNVVLKGSFTEASKYTVTYEIADFSPDGYIVPNTREHYPNSTVLVDSLKVGDIFNGYRFLGWETEDVSIDEDTFTMPSKDVVLVGRFEEVKYTVTYEFYDTVIPRDEDGNPILPPAAETYKPSEEVKLPVVLDVPGYRFLGWYKEDNFVMPEEDVIVYGEWEENVGTFEPIITKEIVDPKPYYKTDDVVKYKIIISNTANFQINDVTIKENNDNAYFIEGVDYEVVTNHNVRIPRIFANSQVVINAEYRVTNKDKGTIKNEVLITGALADNNYQLDTSKEYKATAEFKIIPKVTVCKSANKLKSLDDKFQINIHNDSYDAWLVLKNEECKSVYLEPGKYKIGEVVSQDYVLDSVVGAITSNNATLNVELGKDYEITFINEYKNHFFFHSVGRAENKVRKAYSFN